MQRGGESTLSRFAQVAHRALRSQLATADANNRVTSCSKTSERDDFRLIWLWISGYHWGKDRMPLCFSFHCLFLSLLLWSGYLRTWNNQHQERAALCRLLNKGESQTTTRWPSVFWGQCAAVSTNRRMVTLKLRNSPPFCLINIQLPRVPDEQISEVLRTIGCFGLLEISLRSQYICQGCRRFETSLFFSVKINISTT